MLFGTRPAAKYYYYKMIQSLFILSPTGEVLIERHFRGVTSRSVCDFFWDRASESVNHHGGLSTATSLLNNEEQQLLLPLHDSVLPRQLDLLDPLLLEILFRREIMLVLQGSELFLQLEVLLVVTCV